MTALPKRAASPRRATSSSGPNGVPGAGPEIAVLGAGPVGLDVALAARERGLSVRVYEAAPVPAGNVRSWGHVRLFTPWHMNVSPRMRRGLQELGRPLDVDGDASPTGHEFADRVLDPLWSLPGLDEGLRTGTRVVAVGREGTLKHEDIGSAARRERPFRILLADAGGREWVEHARVVFDCTGKYGNPNTLGDGGIPAPGERALASRIVRRIPDLAAEAGDWQDRTILLAGAGHSAQTAARELAELASSRPETRVLWALRQEEPEWGAVAGDPLELREALTADADALAGGVSPAVEAVRGSVVEMLEEAGGRIRAQLRTGSGATRTAEVDRVLSLTGGVGDHDLYRQLQVHECYATSGPMKLSAALLGADSRDCLDQETHGAETLMNPEPDFFILGDKSYGRNNTFLMQVGWSQVDEVFGALAQ